MKRTNRPKSESFRAAVTAYLMSPLGSGTSELVATKLLALDPRLLGVSDEPDQAIIHAIRSFLEALERARPRRPGSA